MIKQILSNDKLRKLETEAWHCAIIEPKHSQLLLSKLSAYPIENWIKRIKRVGNENWVLLSKQEISIDIPINYRVEIVKVSRYKPLTREQFKEWSLEWPLVFHHNDEKDELTQQDLEIALEYKNKLLKENLNSCYIVGSMAIQAIDKRLEFPLDHAVMVGIEKVANNQMKKRKNQEYLCTGFDLFVRDEPCSMCAMALVHSRIKRVFYLNSRQDGALGSKYKLHVHPLLNHHYTVYKFTE